VTVLAFFLDLLSVRTNGRPKEVCGTSPAPTRVEYRNRRVRLRSSSPIRRRPLLEASIALSSATGKAATMAHQAIKVLEYSNSPSITGLSDFGADLKKILARSYAGHKVCHIFRKMIKQMLVLL
jgi:hypothetical protein